jgi:hypothetical protein
MNLLYMLVCLILIVIAALAYQKLVLIREGFDNIGYETTERPVCPTKLKAKRKNGQTYCNDEKGLPVCAIIADDKTRDGVPACHIILDEYFDAQADNFCPPSMPNYFEDVVAKTSGCSTGLLNDTRTAPREANAPKCIVYNDDQDITVSSSCFNQNQIETTQVFGVSPIKYLIPVSSPDNNGQRAYLTQMVYNQPDTSFTRPCYPDRHAKYVLDYMKRHINKSQLSPEQKANQLKVVNKAEALIKTGNWISSCEAQKRVFIDRTMKESELVTNY